MRTLFTIFLGIFCFHPAQAAITVTINTPTYNTTEFQNELNIDATIFTDYDLKSITATIAGQTTFLIAGPYPNEYVADWILTGVPTNVPLTLTVTATDELNNKQSDTVQVIFASPPPVVNTPEFPVPGSNILSGLHLKGSYSGGDNVKFVVSFNHDTTLYSSTASNSIDTFIMPSKSFAHSGYIYFTATDKWGQQSEKYLYIIYEDNAFLKQLYSIKGGGNKYIVDFNFGKTLEDTTDYVNPDGAQITDLTTGISTLIRGYANFGDEKITPYGVFFNSRLFDWNADTIYNFPQYPFNPHDSLYAVGGHSRYNNSGKYASTTEVIQDAIDPNSSYVNIYLDNLQTHTSSLYATSKGNNYYYILGSNNYSSLDADNDVDSSGHIEYVDNPVVDDNFGHSISMAPATDNYNHAYILAVPLIDGPTQLFEGYKTTTLVINSSTDIDLSGSTSNKYFLNNKFVAYEKTSVSGEVWLLDTFQNKIQLPNSVHLKALNSRGDVIYQTGDSSYLVTYGSQLQPPVNLGKLNGTLYWRDSSWYMTEGRILYKILINAYTPIQDGNWNDPATWKNNIVPPADADVIINNFHVTVTTDATCNSLSVVSPGSITVLPGVNLTVLH